MGLNGKSGIKTTKIYTGTKSKLGAKICDLPKEIRKRILMNIKVIKKI